MRQILAQFFTSRSLSALTLVAASSIAPTSVWAEEASNSPVVVELYTSQGCSSCPPADELLATYSDREDVIALALHIDYWDYIGWKDVFADPKHADRQRAYAHAAGERMIYTPQMVVQGTENVVGYKIEELTRAIAQSQDAAKGVPIQLSATREDGALNVSLAASGALPAEVLVQLVEFTPKEVVEITRGENRGKTIEYSNIVRSWTPVAEWNGRDSIELDVPLNSDAPIAVIVQDVSDNEIGAVLAARRVN